MRSRFFLEVRFGFHWFCLNLHCGFSTIFPGDFGPLLEVDDLGILLGLVDPTLWFPSVSTGMLGFLSIFFSLVSLPSEL